MFASIVLTVGLLIFQVDHVTCHAHGHCEYNVFVPMAEAIEEHKSYTRIDHPQVSHHEQLAGWLLPLRFCHSGVLELATTPPVQIPLPADLPRTSVLRL